MASEYLKWKYRDVKPDEPPKPLTRKEKLANWFYYYIGQSDFVDEVEFGIGYLSRGVVAENSEEHAYYALYYYGIAVGLKHNLAILVEVGVEPCAALASFDKVLRGPVRFRHRVERIAHVDYVGIAVHPVVDVVEFVNQFVLYLVDCHILDILMLVSFVVYYVGHGLAYSFECRSIDIVHVVVDRVPRRMERACRFVGALDYVDAWDSRTVNEYVVIDHAAGLTVDEPVAVARCIGHGPYAVVDR